jgi:hypothetical protein
MLGAQILGGGRAKKGARNGSVGQRGDRSRSRSNGKARGRGRERSNSGNGGRRHNSRPHRNNSRPHSNNGNDEPQHQNKSELKAKPELWAAVERNDEAAVQELLLHGHDPEETHQGWTPLMKAAEENYADVMRMLLDKNVDVEVCNKNGRTALSFAAAPSMNGSERRETAVATLRILLSHCADSTRKDKRGFTAKGRAVNEKREDAIDVFAEFRA